MISSPRATIKHFVYRVSPKLCYFLESLSLYALRLRYERLVHCMIAQHGLVVQSGPFAGMAYVPQATGSALIPKLLGSYEAELHDVITRVFDTVYDNVVDVGCAEGYYAVGLALRLPSVPVYAFDIDPLAQQRCRDMANANRVADRVSVGGECDARLLQTLMRERTLVVCDCEGYEMQLLQPELVPGLCTADVLVELHDLIDPNISHAILTRFSATHNVVLIQSGERDPKEYPALSAFKAVDQGIAITEFRIKAMQWAFMTPKTPVTTAL